MDPSTHTPEIEDQFAAAGFAGRIAVHLARTPVAARAWHHLTPSLESTATPKRRQDFADGRELANRCLATLGCQPQTIARGKHRDPLWPAGMCGSITHTEGLAGALAGFRHGNTLAGVGLDAELITDLEAADVAHVFTERERRILENSSAPLRPLLATSLFSAKEAVFKAQFPITGLFVDFDQVSLEPAATATPGKSGRLHVHHAVPQLSRFKIAVFYNAIGEFVVTGCVIAG
ncbi:MAG: 4'-phosphopantetheinyl transferase superfamily protein [Alphaproteobacteria bacterium]|nr:4'-phosphopantetheinyl transferase superfamily protein [Alphaproteobacteria bacterium]